MAVGHPGGMTPGRKEQSSVDAQRPQTVTNALSIGAFDDAGFNGVQIQRLWCGGFFLRGR
jgi:hypothetical protein